MDRERHQTGTALTFTVENTGHCRDGTDRYGAGTTCALWLQHAILYNARRHHKEAEERFNARYCDLDTLLQESFVCLILPLTDETYHLFGAERIRQNEMARPYSLMPDVARWLMKMH